MSRLVRLAVPALALVLGLSNAARAQSSGADLDYAALTKAPVGAWAEYTMTMSTPVAGPDGKPQPMKPMKMRYALVEKSPKQMTVEIETDTPMGQIEVQMKYEPAGPDAWKIAAGKMKMGTQTMDLPPAQIAKSGQVKKNAEIGKLIGLESVKTPVGTFPCKHYRKTVQDQTGASLDVDIWMSDKVLPAGMVKSIAKAKGLEVVLAAIGTDATPKMK